MNASLDRSIRKFNPGTFQSDDEVIRQFVVRKHELAIVLDILRGNVDSPSCQHVLLVAPRGRGKTMLLARVAAELRTDGELSERLLPVRFMEESLEIFDMVDFWLETLFYLARESATCDPELSRELRDAHAALFARRREEELLEEHARATVREAVDRLGRQIVLMVENMQALCGDVDDDFGWKLRQALQSEPQITLLATATSRFEGLDDARQPFYELFRIICLKPLDTQECRRLWQMVSGDRSPRNGQAGGTQANVRTGVVSEREIRPLEILTGGSPRLLVIVAEFTRHRSLRQLMEDLVKLVDEHTEYFRSHLEAFAKTERRVYLAVIDLWQPSSTGEVAARARMEVRTASTLLGRLVGRGAVITEGSGRKRLYAAAERLYSIYYKLRRERDEAAVVRNLIRFMAVFYTEAEVSEMAGKLSVEAVQSPAIREGIERAVAEVPEIGRVFSSMAWLNVEGTSHQAGTIDNERIKRLVEEVEAAHSEGKFETVIKSVDWFLASENADSLQVPTPIVALLIFAKALAYQELGELDMAIATYDEVVAHFGDSNVPELQKSVARALFNRGLKEGQLGKVEAEIATYDEVVARFGASDVPELQEGVARALVSKGIVQGHGGEVEAAIATCDEVVARFGANESPNIQIQVAIALVYRGIVQGHGGEVEAAIATCDEVVARFGANESPNIQMQVAMALVNKGVAQGQVGEVEAEIATYDEVVARFGASESPNIQIQVAMALVYRGIVQGQVGEVEAEIATYDEVVARFGAGGVPELQEEVAKALVNKGVVQGHGGEVEAAIATCDEVVARFGASESPNIQIQVAQALINKASVQGKIGEVEAEIATCDEVVARFGASEPSNIQVRVAMALVTKGEIQIQFGRAEEALLTCDALQRRFGTLIDDDGIHFDWWAGWVRARALLVQEKRLTAMDTIRSVFAAFNPGNESMMRKTLGGVPDLIAAGASERDLIEILLADREKSGKLAPLVVALRQRMGETVRAPVELIEVATDIRKLIEEKMSINDTARPGTTAT